MFLPLVRSQWSVVCGVAVFEVLLYSHLHPSVSYQGSSGMMYQIEQEQETSSFIADMSCDGIVILELPEEGSDSDEGTVP